MFFTNKMSSRWSQICIEWSFKPWCPFHVIVATRKYM